MGLSWSQVDDNIWESEFPNEYQKRQKLFDFWKSDNKQDLKNDGFSIKKDDIVNIWKAVYTNDNLDIEEICSKWQEAFVNFENDSENKFKYVQKQDNQTQDQIEAIVKKTIQDEISEFKIALFDELKEIKELLKKKSKK